MMLLVVMVRALLVRERVLRSGRIRRVFVRREVEQLSVIRKVEKADGDRSVQKLVCISRRLPPPLRNILWIYMQYRSEQRELHVRIITLPPYLIWWRSFIHVTPRNRSIWRNKVGEIRLATTLICQPFHHHRTHFAMKSRCSTNKYLQWSDPTSLRTRKQPQAGRIIKPGFTALNRQPPLRL
jgi:hypothetical protein